MHSKEKQLFKFQFKLIAILHNSKGLGLLSVAVRFVRGSENRLKYNFVPEALPTVDRYSCIYWKSVGRACCTAYI